MGKDPAFLFYPNDFAAGTMLLNRHQIGCYIHLLIAQFNNGPLTLEEVKQILKEDFPQWKNLSNKFSSMDGRYYNQRLYDEMTKRSKFTASRRSNASSIPSLAQATAEHMEDRNENRNKDIELPNWLNPKAWAAWEQHRKEKNKALTPTSKRLQLKLLEENKETHAQIIKNSITNGWTGLFPLKEDGFRKPNKYIEPNYDRETNERRNFLVEQMKASK